ncbi:MAG: M23 family metallopeptidase [Treponema sp.]|jgi:murein DD-endopeptidase MepM/ murein hydrolase activator NlpD|nr:M23 family metallopeptidase [Treponema sp.]
MNFDQLGKQHVSKRRKPSPLRTAKRSPSSFDASFSQHIWPRQTRAGNSTDEGNNKTTKHSSGGFGIPVSWVKNLSIAAGVLVIGLVSTNWDSISEIVKLKGVSPDTLLDPLDFTIMDAGYEPIGSWRFNSLSDDETVNSGLSYKEIPLNLTEAFTWTEYEVKQGDTITGIASKSSVSSGSIIAFNGIKEAWNIRAGRMLKIPNMDGIPYTVEKNDSLSRIAAKMKVPQNAILDANNLASDTIRPGEVLFIPGARMDANEFARAFRRDTSIQRAAARPMVFPVSGKITSAYGWREDPVNPKAGEKRFHKAVDISGKTGDPIGAAMKGTVLYLDSNPNLGNFIVLSHGEYQTLYAHLSAYSVKIGQEVKQGQEIGKIGETGYTTGPHLHFEAFRNGNRINPLDLVK